MAFIPRPRYRPPSYQEKADGMTGRTGKFVVWEFCYYFSYSADAPNKNRNFDIKIRVATLDTNPRGKAGLMYYIATNIMEHLDIEVTGPDWESRSIGIREVGRANFDAMKYRIADKNPMHTFVWPKKTWGWVPDATTIQAKRELRKQGYGWL